jgi:hypothetical protein
LPERDHRRGRPEPALPRSWQPDEHRDPPADPESGVVLRSDNPYGAVQGTQPLQLLGVAALARSHQLAAGLIGESEALAGLSGDPGPEELLLAGEILGHPGHRREHDVSEARNLSG